MLNIASLKKNEGEIRKFNLDLLLPPLGSGLDKVIFVSPLRLNFSLTCLNQNLFLQGRLETTVRLHCGRCLEQFDLPLQLELKETYYNEAVNKADSSKPEEDWIAYRGDFLDIRPELERAVLDSLPMRPLCQEDCLGLCPICGQNRNKQSCQCTEEEVDPRLSVLKTLL